MLYLGVTTLTQVMQMIYFYLNYFGDYFVLGMTLLAIVTLIRGIITKPTPKSLNTLRKCLCFLIPVNVTFSICPYFLNYSLIRFTISSLAEHFLKLGVATLITCSLMLILPRKNLKAQKVILLIYLIAIILTLFVFLSTPYVHYD